MSQSRTGLRQSFGALAYGDFRRFALSHLLTSIGSQLLQTAIFWQVYELAGSALLLGLTGLARAAPHVVLSLAGGVLADRVNRVRLIQSGQVANSLLIFVLAILTLLGAVEVWHLYIITFLNSAFAALTQPALAASIPRLVPPEKLVNALALNATIGQTSLIIGPAISGVAIGTVGLGTAYVLNGVLYLAAMTAIVAIRLAMVQQAAGESPWRSFLDGLIFVRTRPAILSLLALDLSQTILGSYTALLPIFAESLGTGATGYGLLSSAPGVGSLVGATFILMLGDMKYKGLYTVFGVLFYCGALVLLALSPWFLVTLFAAGLLGVANSVQAIPRNSAILTISSDAFRGRVEAFRSMLVGGGPPLGYIVSGMLAAALGPSLGLVTGAVACSIVVTGLAMARPELRDPRLGAASQDKTDPT